MIRVVSRFSFFLFLSLLFVACGEGAGGPTATTVTDSAGVAIVRSVIDTAGLRAGWTISPEPTLSIGALDGPEEQMLSGVSGGLRLPDGRIAVVDGGSAEVRVFGPNGVLIGRHGGEGEGPGEFTSPALAGAIADSLIVYDGRLRRVSVLHPEDGFARSYEVGSEGGGFPVAIGVLADAAIAFGGGMSFSSSDGFQGGVQRPNSRYVIVSPDGAVRGDLGEVPAADMFGVVGEGSFSVTSIPFGRATRAAAGPDRLWLGTADSWEIRAYSPEARLTRIVRLDQSLTPLTGALWDAAIDERVEAAQEAEQARAVRDQAAEIPMPDVVPPYDRMAVDALAHVWVGEYPMPGQERRTWVVFDPEGRPVGRVTLPARTIPLDIGDDYLLGRTRDDLDVEHVTLWTLTRP